MLPWFQFISSGIFHGRDCEIWENVTKVGNKVNKYRLLVTSGDKRVPVHYEMMGYDTLLGSHYDKYEITYFEYDNNPIPQDIFDVPSGMYQIRIRYVSEVRGMLNVVQLFQNLHNKVVKILHCIVSYGLKIKKLIKVIMFIT